MTVPRLAVAVGLLAMVLSAGAQTLAHKTYIVQLTDAPAATYAGTISGLASTRPATGVKFDATAGGVRAYVNYLHVRQANTLAGIPGAKVLHQYKLAFNGFAARLTDAQAEALKNSGGVLSVTVSQARKLDTTRTPGFLGLSAPGGLWSRVDGAARNVKGEDVIIGMIDSGVWPEDASFSDKVDNNGKPVAYYQPGTSAYGPPPVKWHGVCQTGGGFTSAMCNSKLIGARYYVDDFTANGATVASLEYASPRDGSGHGSHFFRESFDRVTWDEPRGLDSQAVEQLDQARAADLAGEHAARDVVRRISAAVGADPTGHGVHVDTKPTQDFLSHC